jgi:hypothetical protein
MLNYNWDPKGCVSQPDPMTPNCPGYFIYINSLTIILHFESLKTWTLLIELSWDFTVHYRVKSYINWIREKLQFQENLKDLKSEDG